MKSFILACCLLMIQPAMGENMSIESENKETVVRFFESFSKGDPKAFEIVDPNVKWWVPETLPFGGEFQSANEYFGMLRKTFAGFPQGLSLTVKSMVAEGNQVAAEVESNATHLCGTPEPFQYNNKYHFKITLEDGKFVEVKEYNDTKHLSDLYELTQTEVCQVKIKEFYNK